MGFTTSNLSLYHTFSKTPVDSNTSSAAAQLGNAINKSGHTVQSNEIWTESIPFYGLAATTTAIHTKFSATAKVNDLVKDSDGKIWQRNSTAYTEGATFANLWSEKTKSITSFTKGTDGNYTFTETEGALVDGSYLLNSEGVPTVKYYEKRLLTRLTADNNANTNSDNKASRLQIDGKWIDQFIGVTDIYLNGSAAVSYAPVLRKTASSSPMQSGPGKAYMDYCATGLILWESSAVGTEVIDCFEYVGTKLDATVAKLSAAVFGSNNGGSDQPVDLVTQVNLNTAAIATLNGDADETGSVANQIASATSTLASKSEITITDIKVKVGSGTATSLVPDNKSVTIEIPDAPEADVTAEGVVTTDGFTKTAAVTSLANAAIKAALADTTEGSLGDKIGDVESIANQAKSTADSAVQSVTRAAGSSELITVTDGTNATISLSTEVATKADAANAVSEAISGLNSNIDNGLLHIESRNGKLTNGFVYTAIVSDQGEITDGGAYLVSAVDAQNIATKVASDTITLTGITLNNVAVTATDKVANITAIEDVTTTAVNGVALAKDGNNVKVAVTPATYTSSTKAWTNETNVAKASDVKTAISDAISGLNSTIAETNESGHLFITIKNGKLTEGYVRVASVSDQGEVTSMDNCFVTAADAVKIATKAANDLEIPEVANATTDKAGTVKVVTGEVSKEATDASTAPYAVPTVGALAATRDAIEQRITELHKAGVSYIVADTLPTVTAGTEADYNGKIYLVNTGLENKVAADGSRLEYMYVNKGTEDAPQWGWEQIGTTTADLSGYAKSVKISNTQTVAADSTGSIDLSSYKWIKGFYNDLSSNQGSASVPNEESVKLNKGDNDLWSIGVIDATSTDKGLVTLTSTYSATDETSAVTGKAVASAISGLASDADVVKSIKMNNSSAPLTPTNGQIDLGTVVTGFYNADDNGYTDMNAIRIKENLPGQYSFYALIANSAQRGVTSLYDLTADTLTDHHDAAVTVATVKSVYDTLDAKIPTSYVSTVNGISGAITLEAGGNLNNLSDANDGQSTLWGLNAAKMVSSGQIEIIDGFIGDNNTYGNIGSYYAETASLPAGATKVIGNFVYGSDGKVIDTIRAERMVSGFYGYTATGLTEWVADMPNLKDGNYCFEGASITTFIGDLSSLTIGNGMFYGCSALTTFIGDLSSLESGNNMFTADTSYSLASKLNSESVECILESIPDWTEDGGIHKLGIGVSTIITAESDVRQSVKDITGVELTATVGQPQEITYKGWTITFVVSE